MAGTYTQQRITPGFTMGRKGWGEGTQSSPPTASQFTWSNSYTAATAPKQVTTSYRTGRGVPRPSTPTPGELFKSAREGGDYGSIDNGHPFTTSKQEMIFSHEDVWLRGRDSFNRHTAYRGFLKPNESVPSGVESWGTYYTPPSGVSLDVLGAEAIRRTIPTNPSASLATTLGELKREGLPSLVGAQSLRRDGSNPFAKAGGEHLNIEFGWKPLLADTVDTMVALDSAEMQIRQLERDSGRNVRRSVALKGDSASESRVRSGSIQNTMGFTAWNLLFNNLSGTIHETRSYERSTWFKGCYTYHFSAGNSRLGKLKRAQRKYLHSVGLELSPSVAWNLMPWSWASDWVANFGTVLENAEAFSRDGLVLRYGYVMQRTVSTHSIVLDGIRSKDGTHLGPISVTYRHTTKVRKRATPYGFGLATTSFTGRQWGILAALGMTKSNGAMRYND